MNQYDGLEYTREYHPVILIVSETLVCELLL